MPVTDGMSKEDSDAYWAKVEEERRSAYEELLKTADIETLSNCIDIWPSSSNG
jgi:hypothetical protein